MKEWEHRHHHHHHPKSSGGANGGLVQIWKLWRHCCCRYGYYPMLVAPLITAGCLLDLYSSFDCAFLHIQIGFTPSHPAWNVSDTLETGFFFITQPSDVVVVEDDTPVRTTETTSALEEAEEETGGIENSTTTKTDDEAATDPSQTLLHSTAEDHHHNPVVSDAKRYRELFGLDQCQAFDAYFTAFFIKGDRTWEVTRVMAMISAVAGMISVVTIWLIVTTPLPICFVWPGILLPAVMIAFLAEGSKFLFFDTSVCHGNLWFPTGTGSSPLQAEYCGLGRTSYICIAACGIFFIALLMVCLHAPKKRELVEGYGEHYLMGAPLGSGEYGDGDIPSSIQQQPSDGVIFETETWDDERTTKCRASSGGAEPRQSQLSPNTASVYNESSGQSSNSMGQVGASKSTLSKSSSTLSTGELDVEALDSRSSSMKRKTSNGSRKGIFSSSSRDLKERDFRDDESGIISKPASILSADDDQSSIGLRRRPSGIGARTKRVIPGIASLKEEAQEEDIIKGGKPGERFNDEQPSVSPTKLTISETRLNKAESMRHLQKNQQDELIEKCMQDLTKSFLTGHIMGHSEDEDENLHVYQNNDDDEEEEHYAMQV